MIDLSSPLVTASWLQEQLHQDASRNSIVIFDCRFSLTEPHQGRSLYKKGHIPQAIYLDLNQDLSDSPSPEKGRHPLPNIDRLAQKLGACGVTSPDTKIIIYDDSRLAFASRLWWLLRYLGQDQVAILDGGFRAWETLGYPVTTDIPQPVPGQLIPHVRSHLCLDRFQLKSLLKAPQTLLIDARETPRYRGEIEPIDPVAGRIPGAVNACWQAVTESDGSVKPVSFHQQYWHDLFAEWGFTGEGTIVVYCGSGVTACVNLFSLELAGITQAKLYPGSWSEWCHCETAIEVG